MSQMHQTTLSISTSGLGFTPITHLLQEEVTIGQIKNGLCTVFIQHTSASLVIQENADPAVLRDLQNWMANLAPESREWEHADEGPDDMPAHARSALTKTSESIPVIDGRLALGTWQGVYLWEHRRAPHSRKLIVHVQGA